MEDSIIEVWQTLLEVPPEVDVKMTTLENTMSGRNRFRLYQATFKLGSSVAPWRWCSSLRKISSCFQGQAFTLVPSHFTDDIANHLCSQVVCNVVSKMKVRLNYMSLRPLKTIANTFCICFHGQGAPYAPIVLDKNGVWKSTQPKLSERTTLMNPTIERLYGRIASPLSHA